MSWIRRKLSFVNNNNTTQSSTTSPSRSQSPSTIRCEVFKSHWSQVAGIINVNIVDPKFINTNTSLTPKQKPVTEDDADAVRNLLEQMIYLLVEEQTSGLQLGPILEYLITNTIMQKLFQWYGRSGDLKTRIAMNQIKVYEVLISQAQHSVLHHRQLVTPMLSLLSSCSEMNSEEVDGHVVLLLNLLCVWISRDPTLLDVFFGSTDTQGSTKFLIFSILVSFIHREGSIGQQARDALLLCVTMSSENERVSEYIVSTDFCPVLATGLSALYSSLPRQIDVRADEWHFLRKQDWSQVPALVNFMNSFEFCNSVIEAAQGKVGGTLLNYIYNGFLVSVFGPALHKPSASEVIVTTAYLNLFLQSVTAPELLQCFLKFLLCHRHDNSLIINTLIQRIGSNSRLAAVSLSLFRTLLDLDCEDLMLHLVFRYLIPCQHILASQHRSICDVDFYSASAHRFINLSPVCYGAIAQDDKTSLHGKDTNEAAADKINGFVAKDDTVKERSNSQNSGGSNHSNHSDQSHSITSPNTMAEFGPDHDSQMTLHTSYMDYLESANTAISSCTESCKNWSEPYDGKNPPMDAVTEVKGLPANMSTGIRETSLSLLSIIDDENEHVKKHSESDPSPMQYHKMQGSLPSPALHALNATYQALNATANALNRKTLSPIPSDNESLTLKTEDISTPKSTSSENVQASDIEIMNQSTEKQNGYGTATVLTNGAVNSQEDSTTQSCKDDLAIETHKNLPVSSEVLESNDSPRTIENNEAKIAPSQTSSVDDFFRKLMESVPKNARETIEKNISDTKENNIEADDLDSNDADSKDNEENARERLESANSEVSSLGKSTEDQEDEDWGDDTMSINSSFYEPDTEYAPAEYSVAFLAPPLKMHATPYTGPFLSTLFGKVDQMPSNSLYENLLLTGIISRLSCYPQPLLRSFLLNTHVVFHPAVRSLYQVLTGVRNRIESYAENVEDFSGLLYRAEKYLLSRGTDSGEANQDNIVKDTPMPVPKVKTRNTVLGEVFLRRKKRKSRMNKLETLVETRGKAFSMSKTTGFEGQSMFYAASDSKFSLHPDKQNNDSRTKNVVFACVILHEFLKELAAISQEHAVLCE